MSIIIRLQNLPWSANALDIRQFFNGLQIPEGGVHIVGGELGDAFIAFSTDEDARQAFLRTDGKIKGIQIKLMLSSRTEMQRVIEQARNQSMAAFMLPATAAVQPVQMPAPLPAAVPPVLPAAIPELQKETKERDDSHSERKRDRRRSRSKSRDKRDRSRDRRDRRHRDRSRSKSRDRRDRRRGRDRSRSRNRSRDKESRGRRDRIKVDDKREDKDVVNPFQRDTKKPLPEIWNNRPQVPQPSLNIIPPAIVTNDGPNLLRPWGLEPPVKTNFVANMAANMQTRNLNGFQPTPARDSGFGINSHNPTPSRPRESWPPANPPSVRESFRSPRDYPPAPIISNNNNRGPRGDLRGPLDDMRGGPRGEINISKDFRGPRNMMDENIRSPRDEFRGLKPPREEKNDMREDTRHLRDNMQGPRNDLRTELNARRAIVKETIPKRSRFEDNDSPVDACIALDPFYGSYGDLRRFFYGLSINYKGIKVINDEYGHKTGVCFVQFRDASNKSEALKMNGRNLNNTSIKIKHISDQVFEEAIDRYNPRMDELNPCEDQLSRTRNTKKFLSNEPEIKDFVCLKLEDLPTFVKEQDILHIFSQHPLISLHLNFKPKGGTVAYVKFSSKDVAKQAFDERSHHVIRGKPVTVKPCTTEEFNQVNSQQVQAFEEPKPKAIDIGVIPTKIHLMSNNLGFTGQAYCEFESREEALRASAKDNIVLGQNTITVRPISRADMESILGNTLPHPGTAPGQALAPGTPLPPIKPSEVISPAKQEAAAAAPPVADKPVALEKIGSPEKREVQTPAAQPQSTVPSLEGSPKDDANEKDDLEAPILELIDSPPPSLTQDRHPSMRDRDEFSGHHSDEFHERIDFDSTDMDDSHLSFERPRGNFEGPGSRFDDPRGNSFDSPRGNNFDAPRGSNFDAPRGNNFDSPRGNNFDAPRGNNFDAPRGNNFGPTGGHGNFGPPRGGHRGSRFGPRGGSRFNPHRNDSPVDEDVPGCTVFMENVPYKAGTNEILDFFEGHNCTNNVSRRYNPNNTPSSEAKVTFYSPDDAYRAVRELNGQKIWGRVIFLRQH